MPQTLDDSRTTTSHGAPLVGLETVKARSQMVRAAMKVAVCRRRFASDVRREAAAELVRLETEIRQRERQIAALREWLERSVTGVR